MAKYRIIHCMYAEKFIEPFIDFLEKNFDSAEHFFLIKRFKNYQVTGRPNIKFLHETISLIQEMVIYFFYLNRAQKIIIHGLFNPRLVFALFLQPWLLKKCYWIITGGDLYFYELREKTFKSNLYETIRAFVIKRIGHFITQMVGDVDLVRKWYNAKGHHHESFVYQSNLYYDYNIALKKSNSINILVGNSANPTNNHQQIFDKLIPFKNKNKNIHIFCPLSYGGDANGFKISNMGKELFGDKFTPLLEFMPFEKYLELLGEIDIAIFAHERQQAAGNMVTLLGLGKKIYLSKNVTPWRLFEKLGLSVFDVNTIDLDLLTKEQATRNKKIVAHYFSKENLIIQLKEIFE